jgi:quinol monooxygenase YgiN
MNCNDVVHRVYLFAAILIAMASQPPTVFAQNKNKLIRLAVIEADSIHVEQYQDFLKEEIEASIRLEPGVITLYGIAEKQNPERVTLFETYADSAHYKQHLATPHFQKYKQGTLQMVKHLALIEMKPILYHRKANLSEASAEELYIRLIKMEIDSTTIGDFSELANSVMLPGIKKEPGLLVMYAVAEKDRPTAISILEVYENLAAYNKHLETIHYLKYKEKSVKAVRSLQLIDVYAICLGSKPE